MILRKYFFAITLVGIIASGSVVQAAAAGAGAGAGAADKDVAEYVAKDAIDIDNEPADKDVEVDASVIETGHAIINEIIDASTTSQELRSVLVHVIRNYTTPPMPISQEVYVQALDIIANNTFGRFKQSSINTLGQANITDHPQVDVID